MIVIVGRGRYERNGGYMNFVNNRGLLGRGGMRRKCVGRWVGWVCGVGRKGVGVEVVEWRVGGSRGMEEEL